MKNSSSAHSIPAAVYWLVISLAILWGVAWPLMKLALVEMPPLRFRVFCVGVGGFGLLVVCRVLGAPLLVSRDAFWKIAGVSLFSAVGWSLCMAYGLRLMESGRAVIIAYMFPVWSVPLSAWLLNEPLTRRRVVGLVLGMAGLALLLGDEIHAVGRAPLGALLISGAAFFTAVESEIRRVGRFGNGFSLLMLDLDDLKPVNDTFGHPAGDDLLRAITGVITRTIRATDTAGRYGGDEFMILLPETDGDGAFVLAEKLRRDVAALGADEDHEALADRADGFAVGLDAGLTHAL